MAHCRRAVRSRRLWTRLMPDGQAYDRGRYSSVHMAGQCSRERENVVSYLADAANSLCRGAERPGRHCCHGSRCVGRGAGVERRDVSNGARPPLAIGDLPGRGRR